MIYIRYDNVKEKEIVLLMIKELNLDNKDITINDKEHFIGLSNVGNFKNQD